MGNIDPVNFTPEEATLLAELDADRVPRHIAMIMDGNGRWATQQHLPREFGHHAGVETVRRMVRGCSDLGVEYLTLYSFSTENWSRPATEVHALMELIEAQLRAELAGLHEEGIRVRHIGRLAGLPPSVQDILRDGVERTRQNTGLTLTFAINYSGRTELVDVARRLAAQAVAGELDPASLTDDDIIGALYAPDLPDPDLLIRTAGELRVSNFLLWQIAYSELWVTPQLWPDFQTRDLLTAVLTYQQRQRKFGGVVS